MCGEFEPVFIVGAPRSGTTMLTVLMDRHSAITIPPETQYYTQFVPTLPDNFWSLGSTEIVNSALAFPRIADLGVSHQQVLDYLQLYGKSPAGLFRSILTSYQAMQGAERIAEKTPRHNEHVETILDSYPHAKIIALVRDGRDVVGSMLTMPWAVPDNPRRFWLFCEDWLAQMRHIIRNQKRYGGKRHLIVRYEDIVLQPHAELGRICDFINESFEPGMLNTETLSAAVPNWEADWKSKANEPLDDDRLYAWKTERTKQEVWRMNMIMGHMLRKFGYVDTRLQDCPAMVKLTLLPGLALRWPGLRQVAIGILRASRFVAGLFRSQANR